MPLPPLPASIVRHIIYPVYRGIRSDRVLDILDRLEQSAWRTPEEIEDEAWRSLAGLVAYAAAHVPYYRDLFDRAGIDPARIESDRDLRAVPLLDRETVRRQHQRLVTLDPMRRGHPIRTRGITGEPLRIWIDSGEGPRRRANILRGYRWAGVDIGEPVAIVPETGPSERVVPGWSERMKNRFNNLLVLPAPEDRAGSLEALAAAISSWGPALLAGPPTVLERCARLCRGSAGARRRLRAVATFGETLDRGCREAIEEGFGVPVYDRYQMREFSAIAMECAEHRGLHVFSDLFHVEVLRDDGSPAAAGETGEIVVTGLGGRYMPLIRYRTGDLAIRSDRPCPCGRGFPLLERVEGRSGAGAGRKSAPAPAAEPRGGGERLVVKSKIHKAHISAETPDDYDCLRIDGRLLELGDIAPCERILIVNVSNGARLETVALEAPRESGTITAGGAVTRLCRPGDEISVMAFTWSEGGPQGFSNILVDERNRFVRFLTEKAGDII